MIGNQCIICRLQIGASGITQDRKKLRIHEFLTNDYSVLIREFVVENLPVSARADLQAACCNLLIY
jgi:hypothetical protein